MHNLVLAGLLSNLGLWQALKNAMALSCNLVFYIIDRVDECDDSIQLLLDQILDLLDSNVKFHVAFSRQQL